MMEEVEEKDPCLILDASTHSIRLLRIKRWTIFDMLGSKTESSISMDELSHRFSKITFEFVRRSLLEDGAYYRRWFFIERQPMGFKKNKLCGSHSSFSAALCASRSLVLQEIVKQEIEARFVSPKIKLMNMNRNEEEGVKVDEGDASNDDEDDFVNPRPRRAKKTTKATKKKESYAKGKNFSVDEAKRLLARWKPSKAIECEDDDVSDAVGLIGTLLKGKRDDFADSFTQAVYFLHTRIMDSVKDVVPEYSTKDHESFAKTVHHVISSDVGTRDFAFFEGVFEIEIKQLEGRKVLKRKRRTMNDLSATKTKTKKTSSASEDLFRLESCSGADLLDKCVGAYTRSVKPSKVEREEKKKAMVTVVDLFGKK